MKNIIPIAFVIMFVAAGCDAFSSDDDPSIAGYEVTSSSTIVDVNDPNNGFTLRLSAPDTLLTWDLRDGVSEYTFGVTASNGTLSITAWGGGTVDEVAID